MMMTSVCFPGVPPVNLTHLQGQSLFSGQKCNEESVGQAGGQTLLHIYLQYFFPHTSCQTVTVTVTTLLLFDHVTCNGTFLCIKLSEGPV